MPSRRTKPRTRDRRMVYVFKLEQDEGYDTVDREVYMGRDKHENDPLIRRSRQQDIWFHVDNYSSAHLYLRLTDEERSKKFEDLRLNGVLLSQIAQLTKANSIKANKVNNINVIYTPVSNLRTDGSMDVGTVTFKSNKKVKKVFVTSKDSAFVNKHNKSKVDIPLEEFFKGLESVNMADLAEKKRRQREYEEEQKELQKKFQEQKKQAMNPYGDIFTEENVRASQYTMDEDDFM